MQRKNIYHCCVGQVLSYCCETWELTVADEARLRGSGASYDQDDV